MKNWQEEIVKEFVEKITNYRYNDEYVYYDDWADGVRPIIEKYTSNLLEEQKKEFFDLIVKTFNLELSDFPPFPPKVKDVKFLELALIIGKGKYRKEILDCLPSTENLMNEAYRWNFLDNLKDKNL